MSSSFKLIFWVFCELTSSIQAISLRDKFNDGPSKTYVNGNGNVVINLFHIDVHDSNSSVMATSVINDSLTDDFNKISQSLTSNRIGISRTGPLIQIVLNQAVDPPTEDFEDELEAYSKTNSGKPGTSEPEIRRTTNDLDLPNSPSLADFEITLPYDEKNFVTEIPRPMSFHSWYHDLLYSDKKKMTSRYSEDSIIDIPRIEKLENSGTNNVENKNSSVGMQDLFKNNSVNHSSKFKSNLKDWVNPKDYINTNSEEKISHTITKMLDTKRDLFKNIEVASIETASSDSKMLGSNKGPYNIFMAEDQEISKVTNTKIQDVTTSSASIDNFIVKNELEDTEDSVERTFMGDTTDVPFIENLSRGDPNFLEKYLDNDPSVNEDIENFTLNIDFSDFTPKTDAKSTANEVTSPYTSSPEGLLSNVISEYPSTNEEIESSTLNFELTDFVVKTDTTSLTDEVTLLPYVDPSKQFLTNSTFDFDKFYSVWIDKANEQFRSKLDNRNTNILTSRPPSFIMEQNKSSNFEEIDYKNVYDDVQSMTTLSAKPLSLYKENINFKNYPESTTPSEIIADHSRYVTATVRPNYYPPLMDYNIYPILSASYFSDELNSLAQTKETPNPSSLTSAINIPPKKLSIKKWSFDKANLFPNKFWKVSKFNFNLTNPKNTYGNVEANNILSVLDRQRTADNAMEASVSDFTMLENSVQMENKNSEIDAAKTVADKLLLSSENTSAVLPVADKEDEQTLSSFSKAEPVTLGLNISLANDFDNTFPYAISKFLGNVSITTESNQSTPTHSTTVAPKTTSRVSILDFVFKTIGNSVILKTRRKPHRIKRSTRTLRSREKARSFGILASIKSGLLPRPAFPVGLVVPFQNPQSNPPVFTLPAVTQAPPATEAPVMPVVSPNPLPILTTVAPTTDDSPFLPPSTLEPVLPPFPATEEPGIPNQACCSSTRSAQAYFSNPRYPSSDVSSNSVCSVTVIPHSESICQLKVEFLVGRFLPPSKGVCQNQALSFLGTIWPLGIKAICGFNDGQHIYIHIDRSFPLSQRYVNFILRTSTSGQNYNMYLSIQQIDCSSSFDVQAPPGCLQYFTANSGSFSSFNFANGQYLSDTSYKICFYSPRNFCKIVCSSSNGHFMLEKFGSNELIPYTHSGVSSKYCVQDYLLIPSGSANGESPTQDRYCGGTLNPNHGVRSYQPIVAKLNGPIFTVEVKTGISSRFFAPAHTGFSVNYQLISSKCHSSGISEPCKASEATIPSHTVDYTVTNPATNAPHSSVITAAPPIPTTTASFTPNLAYGLPKPKPVYGAPINSYGAITHGPNLHEGHHLPLPSKGSYGVPQPPKQSYGVPQPPKQNYGVPQDAYSVPQSSYSALANGENQGKIDINELFNYFQQLQYWKNLFQNSPGSNNQNHGSQWLENNGNYDTAYNFPSNQYASKQKLSYGPPSNQYTNFGTPINSSSNETSSSYDAPMNSSSLSRGNDPLILPQFGPPSLAQPQFQGKYTALSPGLLPPDPIKHGDASEENEKLLRNEIRKKSIDIDSDYYDERR